VNELIFKAIAEGRGMTLESWRSADGLHMIFRPLRNGQSGSTASGSIGAGASSAPLGGST
jgi:hypothetical protein